MSDDEQLELGDKIDDVGCLDTHVKRDLNYVIDDFQINSLPECNPIRSIIKKFVQKRNDYQDKKEKKVRAVKPKLENLLKQFKKNVMGVNHSFTGASDRYKHELLKSRKLSPIVEDERVPESHSAL